jgi:hypothetical protein
MEDCAHSQHDWFQSLLTLPGGVPSHDTFNRVFSALDPEELEKRFVAWVLSIVKLTSDEAWPLIDGKTLRSTSEPSQKGPCKKAIVHMVSARAGVAPGVAERHFTAHDTVVLGVGWVRVTLVRSSQSYSG